MAKTMFEVIIKAKETFYQNADVMVAGFLIRHPDIDPADVELVMMPVPGEGLRFSIEPKELHVPPAMAETCAPDDEVVYSGDYVDGWNACREAMIAKKAKARPDDALVTALATVTTEAKDG